MIAAILSFLAMIGRLIFGHAPDPVKEAEENGERVGTAEVIAKTQGAANDEITRSSAAGDAIAPVVASPDKLRDYESRDPNNRDNS